MDALKERASMVSMRTTHAYRPKTHGYAAEQAHGLIAVVGDQQVRAAIGVEITGDQRGGSATRREGLRRAEPALAVAKPHEHATRLGAEARGVGDVVAIEIGHRHLR